MTKKQVIELGRLINGGTVYHNENMINKEAFIHSVVTWLRDNNTIDFDPDRFCNACYGTDKLPLNKF